MAIFEIVEGKPGNCKSLYTARKIRFLADRNIQWYKKTGHLRKIATNIKMSSEFEDKYSHLLIYWTTMSELVKLRDVDIIIDEIATYLDSRDFINLGEEEKRFLSQYRKRGLDIYANTQDYSMIDRRARLMVTHVYKVIKVIGSRDPSPTKPPVKYIWGLAILYEINNFLKEDELNNKKINYFLPSLIFPILKADVLLYDTSQDIRGGELPPLRHIERFCQVCGKRHITHK